MLQLFALFAQDPTKTQPGFPIETFVLFGAIFLAGYFILLRPMKQREKKERDELFTKLKKNDEVLTASGLIGIVAAVKDDEVVLKVDESSNVRLRVLKSAIVRILNPKEPVKDATGKTGSVDSTSDGIKAGSPPAGK